MKRHINWKALLILVLVVCFALVMVACNGGGSGGGKPNKPGGNTGNNGGDGDDEGSNAGDAAIAAIEALVEALDKTLPKNASKDTDIISATLNIGAEFDGFTVKKESLDMENDFVLDQIKAVVAIAANLDANNADKNAAKIGVRYKGKEDSDLGDLVSLYTKGSTAYFKYKGDANYYAVNVGDNNGSTYNNIDYVKYLQQLPALLGETLGNTDIVGLISGLMDTIDAAKDLVGGILDSQVTDEAITLKLKVEGLAGLADTLNSIVGSVLDQLDPSGNIKDIVLNKALNVILGAGLSDISQAVNYEGDELAEFKEKLSQIEIVVDKTSDGAIEGLNINVAAGKDNPYWSGAVKINIGNLSVKLEENSVVADEVAKFEESASAPAVQLNVKAELPADSGFSMNVGLAISPSVVDDEMLIQLSTASLEAEGALFDKDDLCAVYGVHNGQSGIYVDLAALYKVAYKDEIAANPNYLDGIDTQYFYPIEIGDFLTNLYSSKYVLVDYAGGGSHGVYDYCWFSDGNDSYNLDKLKKHITENSELMARIREAYGISDTEAEFEFFIGSYWHGPYEGGIKSVSVVPSSQVTPVNVTVKSYGDKSSSIKLVSGSTLSSALGMVDYNVTNIGGNDTFVGWTLEDGTPVNNDYVLKDGDVIIAQFKDYTHSVDNKKEIKKASVYVLVDNNGSLEYSLDQTIYFVKYNKRDKQDPNVYDFGTAIESSKVVKDAVLEIAPASPVNGLKFSGWYGSEDNENLSKIDNLKDNAYASDVSFYAIYVLDDAITKDTKELTGSGYEFYESRFSTVAAIRGKDDKTSKQSPMYQFTGESTDVMSMILGNIDTALQIVKDRAIDTDTLVKILGGINDLGITADDLKNNMDGAKEKIANWLLYFLSRADANSADRIYNYKNFSTSVTYGDASATAYASVAEYKTQLSKMVDYITYLRFAGIYGNLTSDSASSLGLAMDATSSDYTGASDKVAKYVEMENAAQVALMNASDDAHDLTFYNNQILGYIKGYLGESALGGATTLKDFLFGENMSVSIGFENALVLTLKRGDMQLVKLTITGGIMKVEDVSNKVDINKFSDPVDFRSWNMGLIELSDDNGTVDTSEWTNEQIYRFSTLSIVDGENHKITFEGKEYSYNPEHTQFISKVVYELMQLNLKLSGQN